MRRIKRGILAAVLLLFLMLLLICKFLDSRSISVISKENERPIVTEAAQTTVSTEAKFEHLPQAAESSPETEETTLPTETTAPTVHRKPSYSNSSGTNTAGTASKETTPPTTSPPATSPPAPSAPATGNPTFIPGEDETPGDLL